MRFRSSGLLLFSLIFYSGNLPAQMENLRFDLRWETSVAQDNTVDQTVLYEKPLLPELDVQFGVRLAETAFALHSLSYKAEIVYHFCRYFDVNGRIVVRNLFPDKVGTSTYLAHATIHTPYTNQWAAYASVGWFERFTLFEGLPFYPRFSRDLPERDWIFTVAGRVLLIGEWGTLLEVSNLEPMDVMNLNNPFATWKIFYDPDHLKWRLAVFARYRILLGFGRLDSFLVGTTFQFPL